MWCLMKRIGFQCQEQGHIAWNCPNIRCFECDENGHIVMDWPHWIPPSGTPANHHQPKHHRSCPARSSSGHHHEDRYGQSWSRSQSHFCRHRNWSHHDSYRGCSRLLHWDNHSHKGSSPQCSHSTYRGYSHQSCHDTPHQPHCRSSTHRSSLVYHSRDYSRSHSWPSYKSSRQDLHRSYSHSSRWSGKPHLKKNLRVKTEDPHTDYYSSDELSSDSEEESDPLN